MTRKVHKSISDAGQIEGTNTIKKVVLPVEPIAKRNINPSAKRRHRIPGHRESPTSTSFWTSSATFGNCRTEKTELITNYNKIK